jgi:ribosome maturation factor RimP
MHKERTIETLIAPAIDDLGYEIVRVRRGGGGRPVLQIMVERKDRHGMTVDDCARVSRAVSALLDVADPIASSYVLEVSSPGIDRPLTRREDYLRFAGHEARVDLNQPHDGKRRLRCWIVGIEGDVVALRLGEGEIAVPFQAIESAKLVMTDALLAAAAGARH